MNKIVWNIFFTISFIAVLFVCIAFQKNEHFEQYDIADQLFFVVNGNELNGISETIKCWKQDDSHFIVFLPSYADISRLQVHLESFEKIIIDGIELSDGMFCNSFILDQDYELILNGTDIKLIRFVQSSNVSSMFVSTSHSDLSRIHENKVLKEQARISVHTSNGQTDYCSHVYDDQIRGHGNTTWEYDKKSYNLYLKRGTSLLNMDASKEWVLLANAIDETNLRNKIIYDFVSKLSSEIQMAPQCEYVELYIDGEYRGLYLLTEKVESVANKVIKNHDYILICQNNRISKLDNPEVAVKLKDDVFFEIEKPSKGTKNKYIDLAKYLHEADQELSGKNWSDYVDMRSFAVKYLIEEVFSNVDGASASQYYYWDRDKGCLYAGPCWDYDLTLGDTTWIKWISPNNLHIMDGVWFGRVFEKKEFCECYKEIYQNEFLPLLNDLVDNGIIDMYQEIERASCNNFLRWEKASETKESYSPDEILTFLSKRIDFLNSNWIDNEEYCKITMNCNGIIPIASLYIPKNSSATLVPKPREMGFDDLVWICAETNKPFDNSQIISNDVSLYVDNENKENAYTIVTSKLNKELIILIVVFLLVLFATIRVDYGYNWRGRHINE